MPVYTYTCVSCDSDEERILRIDDRDNQFCKRCANRLNRSYVFEGAVYAPTSTNGTMK